MAREECSNKLWGITSGTKRLIRQLTENKEIQKKKEDLLFLNCEFAETIRTNKLDTKPSGTASFSVSA